MDIRQLRYFSEAAALQNISKAAEKLHVAQPALTRRIHDLEEELGVELFSRVGRRVVLTRAGERLLQHAGSILEQVERARHSVIAEGTVPTGRVAIGAPPGLASLLFTPLAQHLVTEYPRLRLFLAEGLTASLLEQVERGELDLAIVSDWPEDSRYARRKLYTEPLFLIGAAGHPLMARASVGLGELQGLPLILAGGRNHTRQRLDEQAHDAGVDLEALVEVESWGTLRQLVLARLGYTISVRSAFEAELRSRKVKAVPLEGQASTRWLVRLADRPSAPAFEVVEAAVLEHVARLDVGRST